MIKTKELKTLEDFENLKKGDMIVCEFHRDIHDYPKSYKFGVFAIALNRSDTKEIILQRKNNIYFNYEMFLSTTENSNLKHAMLINSESE